MVISNTYIYIENIHFININFSINYKSLVLKYLKILMVLIKTICNIIVYT